MRRRLVAAIFIISLTLGALAWVDNQVLLRNPTELDTRARLLLAKLFPDYSTKIRHIEVDFPSHVVVEDLALNEKHSGRTLIRIERVEANLSLTDWLQPRDVLIRGVRVNVRRDRQGKLNFDVPQSEPVPHARPSGGGLPLSSPVKIGVEDARLLFEDEDVGARVLLHCTQAQVTAFPGGRVSGIGQAEAGAIVSETSPFAAGGTRELVAELPGVVYRPLLPHIGFEVDRRESGVLRLPVDVEQVSVGPMLRSVLPRYVQDVIWDELNPTGLVNARVTIRVSPLGDVRPEVYIAAKNATLRLKGFPYPIHDINGRFEIAPGVVAWEDTTARLDGDGRITKARGSFFLGETSEKVTLFCYCEASDVPLNETLRSAIPADIRQVYDQFLIQGVSGPAKVMVFKGPFQEDPQLSIRTEFDGRQSAAFADYPVRLTAEKGTFTLKEGGNVEVDAEGTLEGGGHTKVDARVVHGDLMSVHVRGEGVPVSPSMTAKLEPEVRRMVAPFRPNGGTAGFDLVVTKSDPASRPVPRVKVKLDHVGIEPEPFPLPITASGDLKITPSWREGAGPNEKPRIDVALDLAADGRDLAAAVVSGTVVLDPSRKGVWSGEISGKCAQLRLGPELRRALPGDTGKIFDDLAPEGAVRNVSAHVRSTEVFEAAGEGEALTAALSAFPYRAQIDRFSLARDGRSLALRRVEGRTAGDGRFSLEGALELPPDLPPGHASGAPGARDPFVSVAIRAKGVPVDEALVAALPPEAREPLAKLEPSGGKLDANLAVVVAPPLPLELRGELSLAGGRIALHHLEPNLAGLDQNRVEDVTGVIRLEGDRVEIEGVKARFRGAPVVVAGSVAMGARGSGEGDGGIAPVGSAASLDIVAHVDGLLLDAKTRALARGSARNALERFPIDGPCDLDLEVRRGGAGPALDLRIEPRGIKVVPQIAPLPFEDVRGTIEVKGEEPVFVELTARMGHAKIEVQRDRRHEAFAPAGTSVYLVRAQGVNPKELAERGPEDLAKVIRDTDLTGSMDLSIDVAVPPDDRAKSRFLAEIDTQGLDVTSGLRFEKVVGTLRVAGSVAKFEPLDLEGALQVESATWKKQELKAARIPVRLHEGMLSLGSPRDPFVGTFYGGNLRGRVDTNLKTSEYSGYLFLDQASLGEAADELSRLHEETKGPKHGGAGGPIHGELVLSLTFRGGGTDPSGKPVGIHGDAVVQASKANLIGVPLLFGTLIDVFAGAARGDSSFDPKSFDSVYAKLRLKPQYVGIDVMRLDSDTLTLGGKDGRLDWDGKIDLDLLPFKTGGGIFDDIFKQFVGVSVRGTVSDPVVKTIPFSNALDRTWNGIKHVIWPEDEGK